jgi:hypothetical protein
LTRRGCAVVFDGLIRLVRHDEADRPQGFLVKVGRETGCAGQQRHGLERLERPAGVQDRCRNGSRHIDRQRPLDDARRMLGQRAQCRDVTAGNAKLIGNIEQTIGTRIAGIVLRVAQTRHLPAR